MAAPDHEDSASLAARHPGARALDLEVVGVEMRTPAMRRIRLVGEGVADLVVAPGQDLMVVVPADGHAHFRRRYTIRHHDAASFELALDVVLHGEGPGARWARAVRVGDRVDAVGPRGKIHLAHGAAWHAFFGDESAIPAIFAMVEGLDAGLSALALLDVAGAQDVQEPDEVACELALHWLHRTGGPGTGDQLARRAAQVALPHGHGHCYVFGEHGQVAAVRAALTERGVHPADISHKAYWRLGRSNAAHGEPPRPERD